VRPADRVLVHAASGGLGQLLVQDRNGLDRGQGRGRSCTWR
jgi:hypothetical protein